MWWTYYINPNNSLNQATHTPWNQWRELRNFMHPLEFNIKATLCTWGHSPVTPCRYKTSPFVPTVQTPTEPSCLSIWIDMSRSLTWGGTRIHGPVVISFDRLMKEKKWCVGNMNCFCYSSNANYVAFQIFKIGTHFGVILVSQINK